MAQIYFVVKVVHWKIIGTDVVRHMIYFHDYDIAYRCYAAFSKYFGSLFTNVFIESEVWYDGARYAYTTYLDKSLKYICQSEILTDKAKRNDNAFREAYYDDIIEMIGEDVINPRNFLSDFLDSYQYKEHKYNTCTVVADYLDGSTANFLRFS